MNTRRIYVKCMLFPGSFSGEVVFSIEGIEPEKYDGIAPRRSCATVNNFPVDVIPASGIEGKVVAVLVANGGQIARVALPDGEAIKVNVNMISEREMEIADVSV